MSNLFRFLLELIRVIIILFAGLWLLFSVESKLFLITLEGTPFFLLFFANLLLILVLYRNKLQFSGWYKGKEVKRLSPQATNVLIVVALLAFVSSLFLKNS
ncbi:hypothetical protein P4V43_15210 [Brevibacillus fortis]|uniref:hypothetical protein n=1 Tax=Brevibacillus fortis TaxID=2126352 RepID=UPI002E23D5B6|nr:hypothetical protein [Brevibacillus fortis]